MRVRGLLLPLLLLACTACTVPVDGRAVPEPDPARPVATVPRPALVADVLDDECLLDGAGFARLLGTPVAPPVTDGRPRSCAASGLGGAVLATINVYAVREGVPTDLVRSGRRLDGVGDAAAVVDTVSGPTLQVAAGDVLVTIAVADRAPSDARWVEAGRAAVAALP